MRSFTPKSVAVVSAAEASLTAHRLHCSTSPDPRRLISFSLWPPVLRCTRSPLQKSNAVGSYHYSATVHAAHTTTRRCFTAGGSGVHDVINADEIDFVDSSSTTTTGDGFKAASGFDAGSGGALSFESTQAWSAALSQAMPSAFEDVEEVDGFARPRILTFVRRYRTKAASASESASSSGGSSNNGAAAEANAVPHSLAEFITEELPQSGGIFHARLRVPVTPAAARFLGCDHDAAAQLADGLWAHGVANTAKDAELLAAMHAERMADLLGYHLYTLPSRQRKHAEAVRQAGRYASSPDDVGSGPSAHERRQLWPLPLRRVLTDEETEGGKWQLVDTSPTATRFIAPAHTLLSPCLLDPQARARIEAKFAAAAAAPSGCPGFTQQLTVARTRTLTASSVASGGAEFMVAELALPPQLTTLAEPVLATGKAEDRATAVLLACMHAELLLDALHIPLFDDAATQQLHSAAAWSFGRPAPMAGAKPRTPSHVHLPDPLKQLLPSARPRTAMRTAEEEYFHRHHIVTEQTGSFVETVIGEANAVAVLMRFLELHHAPRASAPFLQTAVAGRIRSTVVLPLPESYGIRGGVGIANNAQDADTLAAMHALDVLCLLGIPVLMAGGEDGRAASADAAWKAARRERLASVPVAVSDPATPSPPARRCSGKTFASVVTVIAEAEAEAVGDANGATSPPTGSTAAASGATPASSATSRRRVVKRARLSSEAREPTAKEPASVSVDAAHDFKTDGPSAAAAPPLTPAQEEAAEREARLTATRTRVDAELWDLHADSPDGYIMIAPGAQQASATADYAIVSPRKLDKQAKARVIDYLSAVGRRLEEVRVRQSLSEDETDGRPRHRCALRLPLPAVCGEPRLALGEADTVADAEHAACMHAELLLDTLGVCLYTDVVKQLRHAEACAQWGRWAPTGTGQEKPASTPSPPPLRREHAGSLHWERKKAAATAAKGKGGSGFATSGSFGKATKPAMVSATAKGDSDGGSKDSQRAKEKPAADGGEDDLTQYALVTEADLDPVARMRVQYFLRHERLTATTPTYTTILGRGVVTHSVSWELPIPARFCNINSSNDSNNRSNDDVRNAASTLSYTVRGAATTRKDADLLSWMHAERLLDALDIPLFPNLPLLQAYHAAQVRKAGRHATSRVDGPHAALPPPDALPLKPLRLQMHTQTLAIHRPAPPPDAAEATPERWEAYVAACEGYVTAVQHAASVAYFNEGRAPRTGDPVVDAALNEAEAAPSDNDTRALLGVYLKEAQLPNKVPWVISTVGETLHRVSYATFRIPGFEVLTARGVGATQALAKLRAAKHALCVLRRVDPEYEDRYNLAKTIVVLANNKAMELNKESKLDGIDDDADDFDLETFSTLPSISAEAYRLDNRRSRRYMSRVKQRFVSDSSRINQETELTDEGKRRAVQMYALCCGVGQPQERQFVRLLPRQEETANHTTVAVQSEAALKLEVKTESADDEDPMTRRVAVGASYAVEVSVTDEEGRVWTGRGDRFSPKDNRSDAYDKLYRAMTENLPLMQKVKEILNVELLLRPEEIPLVEITDAMSARIQACLRNQKDLLLAESETGSWDSQEWERHSLQRAEQRHQHEMQLLHGSSFNVRTSPRVQEAEEVDAIQAAESAALLEKLQQRITNPEYLENYALKRAKLSIAEHKSKVLQAIRENPVTVVCGTTGCGKTTQIPQYILDDAIEAGVGGRCKILVTQPRRLSTISVARRVAEERMEKVGDSVGYMIRFSSNPGRHLNFATTGVLLRLMHIDPDMKEYTHIIIDEIHERELFTDFIIVLLRELVARRPDLRVVLMSATLQASEFQRYFNNAPLIQVQGYMFPVREMYLEDLVPYAKEHDCMTPLLREAERATKSSGEGSIFGSNNKNNSVGQPPDMHGNAIMPTSAEEAARAMSNLRIDSNSGPRYDVLEVSSPMDYSTIKFAVEQATRLMDLTGSSILVFLPGWNDIKMMQQQLETSSNFYVLLLHSAVNQEAQMQCFLPAPPGKIKVILSTNIAESGVTIDDVGAVIDCGRLKEKSFATRTRVVVPRTVDSGYDYFAVNDSSRVSYVENDAIQSQSSFTQLLEVYASRANCVQRRGRVGRTRPGLCIRLFSRHHFDALHHYQTPEMLRVPLDVLCLTILSLRVSSPAEFLSRALEPPLESEVRAAMKRLHELGAVGADGRLTALGYRLSQLPIAPAVGKTILLGAALRCLDSAMTVAAGEQHSLFLTGRDDRAAVRIHRENLSANTLSDHLASVNAYNFWVVSKLTKPPAEMALDLKSRYLNVPGLLHTSHLKRQLFGLLADSGFVPMEAYKSSALVDATKHHYGHVFVDSSEYSRNTTDVGLVKAVIAAGLFPNIALLSGRKLMRTGFENFVKLSSDSVLNRSSLTSTSNPFFVYRELSRVNDLLTLTGKDFTSISFWAIFLFGTSRLSLEYNQDLSLVVVDKWLFFRASFRVVEQIRKLKALLDRRLNRKFVAPSDPVNNAQLDVLCGIVSDLMNAPVQPSKDLIPSMIWEEKGSIIDTKYSVNFARGSGDELEEPEDVVDEEEDELE